VDHVVAVYDLDASALRLLVLACESWDRCASAREMLDREGVTTLTASAHRARGLWSRSSATRASPSSGSCAHSTERRRRAVVRRRKLTAVKEPDTFWRERILGALLYGPASRLFKLLASQEGFGEDELRAAT
jgi:hypothetical protein